MNNTLVSIITPMYNASRYIACTIESICNQIYTNWELIIIDDCSTDNKAGELIVREYAQKDKRIKYFRLSKNKGSSGARNEGIRRAKGLYICMLDSDDLWEPDFLSEQVNFIKQTKGFLVFSSFFRINKSGEKILSPFIVPDSITYHELLKTNKIGCLTSLFNSAKTGKQLFNEELGSIRDDYEYWLRMLKANGQAFGNKKILASYRILNDSVTGNKIKMIKPQWNIYRKIEKLSILQSAYYLLHWAWNGFWKYKIQLIKKN